MLRLNVSTCLVHFFCLALEQFLPDAFLCRLIYIDVELYTIASIIDAF